MKGAAAIFLLIAIGAGLFGFGGLAAGIASIGKIVFWAFVMLAAVALLAGVVKR
jgi:uncharacterized membrane protein YtjA (UPF0391 family)